MTKDELWLLSLSIGEDAGYCLDAPNEIPTGETYVTRIYHGEFVPDQEITPRCCEAEHRR